MIQHFKGSLLFTAAGVVGGYLVGGWAGAWIVLILGILETSLSFDNAVLNARVLKDMDAKWQRRFLTWGMLIAVFGMRIVFPIVIVAVVAHMSPWGVLTMAVGNPDEYARILSSAHHQIAAFGGAFLMMVFLKFMLDANKDVHWLSLIERPLTRLGRMEAVQLGVTLLIILSASTALVEAERLSFIVAGVWGVISYIIADGIGGLLGEDGDHDGSPGTAVVVKSGLAGFLYLEVLDASMSFDGVIGAFALSHNIFIIAIGLGIGAMFVRSMTIYLVKKGTLGEFRYLEHGAFWAIGALAAVMFLGVVVHVPEVITGLIGAFAIVAAIYSSIRAKRADEAAGITAEAE